MASENIEEVEQLSPEELVKHLSEKYGFSKNDISAFSGNYWISLRYHNVTAAIFYVVYYFDVNRYAWNLDKWDL